jgi:hypothetical protein
VRNEKAGRNLLPDPKLVINLDDDDEGAPLDQNGLVDDHLTGIVRTKRANPDAD